MDLALGITAAGGLVNVALLLLGVRVSLTPPSDKHKPRYMWSFVVLGMLALAFQIALQVVSQGDQRKLQVDSNEQQNKLRSEISVLRAGIANVEQQTKQPPNVNVAVPPPTIHIVPDTAAEERRTVRLIEQLENEARRPLTQPENCPPMGPPKNWTLDTIVERRTANIVAILTTFGRTNEAKRVREARATAAMMTNLHESCVTSEAELEHAAVYRARYEVVREIIRELNRELDTGKKQ